MSRPAREAVMVALLNVLKGAIQTSFTANTVNNSQVLASPSTSAGLFLGLPVFGAGIPRGAIITGLSPLTISLAATADGTAVPLETGFVTVQRRATFTRQVPCPALFLRSLEEENEYQEDFFQVLTMKAEAIIVSNAGENQDVIPETALHNFLDAIQAAMAPDNGPRFTMGGLVYWCRMKGKVDKSPGDLGPQAIAYADIEIIIP